MPFKPEDAEKHKKGLSDKGKRQWARIAESVRKKEMKAGKSEEEAAVSAIKQANGVVNVNSSTKEEYTSYKAKVLEYEAKLVTHQDKAHIVVPVVMMVEGVHSGSQGPLLHTIMELGKFPDSWNGIPVVIYHPEEDGQPVSANSPDIIDKVAVGRVYNTNVDGGKLKAEVWFDEDKLNAVSEVTLNNVNEGKEMEVSLGMFTENEYEEGEFEGQAYIGIAHNHRPDHLAILPDQIGACSCAKGCGLGANQNRENMKPLEMMQSLNKLGFAVNQIGNYADKGYNEIMSMMYDKLRSLDTQKTYTYLEECYDDYVIYSVSGDNNRKMYKQAYKIESGKVEFVGDPVEVHKKVEYVLNRGIETNDSSINKKSKEDKNMPTGKDCPNCKAKVDALIANEKSPWKEANREWLLTQEETVLDKLTPVEIEKVVEKTVEVNKLTPEQTADLAFVANMRKEKKAKMVKDILDNTEAGTWDDATLTAMSEEVLAKVHKSVAKKVEAEQVDYSMVPGFTAQAKSDSGGPLYMPGIEIESDKK